MKQDQELCVRQVIINQSKPTLQCTIHNGTSVATSDLGIAMCTLSSMVYLSKKNYTVTASITITSKTTVTNNITTCTIINCNINASDVLHNNNTL